MRPTILTVLALCSLIGDVRAADSGERLKGLVAGPATHLAGGFRFTEGPAWHPDGYLLFSDIPNMRVHKFAGGDVSVWWEETGRTNGLAIDAKGNVYACQGGLGRVSLVTAPDHVIPLAAEYDGKRLNMPNDVALDGDGGLYFTDPVYGAFKPVQPVLGVYYVAEDGTVTRVVDDLPKPNGVIVSPDGNTLYVANPEELQIVAYDITGPGKIANKRVLFTGERSKDGDHGPDGMCLDVEGRLYATYTSVVVVEPNGELIGRIAIPEKPANCIFGGDAMDQLFVTARTGLYSVPMRVRGAKLMAVGPRGLGGFDGPMPIRKTQADAPPAEAAPEVMKVRDVTLTVPPRWNPAPPANKLRLAQFAVPAADGDEDQTEFVVFPPFGGTPKANIERWIGQFSGDKTLEMTRGDSTQGSYVLVDMTGTYKKPDGPPFLRKTIDAPDYRMLAAILTTKKGGYFLKMVGPKATVMENADAFRAAFGADASSETEYELE